MTEYDNTDLFEAKSKSILRFLNVFITIFKEDLQIKFISQKCPDFFYCNPVCVFRRATQKHNGAAFSLCLWITMQKERLLHHLSFTYTNRHN